MRRILMGTFLIVCLAAVYAYATPRSLPERIQLLGFTEQRSTGSAFELAAACEAEFPGSRVCTPRDIMRTAVAPESVAALDPEDEANAAWIDGTSLQWEGASLVCQVRVPQGSSTAQGFSVQGAVVGPDGNFGEVGCGMALRVACCGRRPASRR